MLQNTDTIWSRSNAQRAGTIQGKEKKALGGKEIMHLLDIEDDSADSIHDEDPIKMMDLVLKIWDEEEKENKQGDHEDQESEEEDEE